MCQAGEKIPVEGIEALATNVNAMKCVVRSRAHIRTVIKSAVLRRVKEQAKMVYGETALASAGWRSAFLDVFKDCLCIWFRNERCSVAIVPCPLLLQRCIFRTPRMKVALDANPHLFITQDLSNTCLTRNAKRRVWESYLVSSLECGETLGRLFDVVMILVGMVNQSESAKRFLPWRITKHVCAACYRH